MFWSGHVGLWEKLLQTNEMKLAPAGRGRGPGVPGSPGTNRVGDFFGRGILMAYVAAAPKFPPQEQRSSLIENVANQEGVSSFGLASIR